MSQIKLGILCAFISLTGGVGSSVEATNKSSAKSWALVELFILEIYIVKIER
jgi:hypothetical protein